MVSSNNERTSDEFGGNVCNIVNASGLQEKVIPLGDMNGWVGV